MMNKFKIQPVVRCILFFCLYVLSGKVSAQCTAVIGSNINPIEGCELLTVQFSDSSTSAVQSRIWNFGDGTPTSSAQNPSHSFNAGTGDTTYIVSLSIQCVGGLNSVAFDTVTVFAKPDVSFNAVSTTACAISDTVCFNNLSDNGLGYIYNWQFGDNSSSSAFEPCHIYTTDNAYTVSLTVTNNKGCQNTATLTNYITIIQAPNPDFTVDTTTGCSPLVINFNNITSVSSIASWSWDFDDGTPVYIGFNPVSHTFTAPGTYFITLGATNTLGCYNSTTRAIVVKPSPVSTFTAGSPVCVSSNALITYTGSASGTAIFNWDFDGGSATPGTGIGPHNVQWTTAGYKTISLMVTENGCDNTSFQTVLVNPLPVVAIFDNIANDTICTDDNTIFTANPGNFSNYKFFLNSSIVQNRHKMYNYQILQVLQRMLLYLLRK